MSPHRRISSFASPSICLCSTRKEIGLHPESNARSITFGLSAIKIPFSGSARFKSCISEILAYTSSSGALKSVISMIFDMIVFSCSVFLFLSVYCSRISLQKKARCYLTPPGFAITYKTVCFFFRSVLPSTGSYPRSLRLYSIHSKSHGKVRRRSSSVYLLILLL